MDGTTTFLNVQGRSDFLKFVSERKNCSDIEGVALTEAGRYAYALCEEVDQLKKDIEILKKTLPANG